MTNGLRLAFYGDDFTGSTDALEALTSAGLRSVLFLEPPTALPVALLNILDLADDALAEQGNAACPSH
jgi:uncharacterized protein YgbK (DUF1537 family)